MERIFINGEPCTVLNSLNGGTFIVDYADHPTRRFERHYLDAQAVADLRDGARIYVRGNWYSLSPDSFTRPQRTPSVTQSRLRTLVYTLLGRRA